MAAESGYVVDSAALVAPITALEFVGEEYLLTGELPTHLLLQMKSKDLLTSATIVKCKSSC